MGTAAWENWRAYNDGLSSIEHFEDELYSDVTFTGDPVQLGPYKLSLVHRWPQQTPMGLSLLLEGDIHINLISDLVVDRELAPTDKTNYYGGTLSDEIASLVSLELGVRLRYAGCRMTSGFNGNGPILFAVAPFNRPGASAVEVVPFVMSREPRLDHLHLTAKFANLDESDQRAVVRAAMSYSSAVWWANQDPGQAWLQLVTALEVAGKHKQAKKYDHAAVIEAADPDLWTLLQQVDDPVRTALVKKLAGPLRATQTFKHFVASHAPEPPQVRSTWDQVDWDDLETSAGTIYRHRSDWLHQGVPLPMPLIETRTHTDSQGTPAEVPMGNSSGSHGAIWEKEEYPMTLSMFEYIARGALLKWWGELTT